MLDPARPYATPLYVITALALLSASCVFAAPLVGGPDPSAMAAILLASVISGTAGFAFSAVCGGILFHLWDDKVQVVQVMILCSVANQATMVWALRREVEWRNLPRLLIGGFLGLPVGIWLLLHADRRLYTHGLGLFLIGYSGAMLLAKRRPLVPTLPKFDLLVGLVAGITGGAAALPGAPVTIWSSVRGLDRVGQRALFQPFILILQVCTLVAIALCRPSDAPLGFEWRNLLCVPVGLLGTWLGMACFRRLSNRQFAVAVDTLLIVSGLSFVL